MNHRTFTVLIAVFCFVTADFHLPDEEGFIPGLLQTEVLPPMLPLLPVADIPLPPTPELLEEQSVDPLVAQVNNRELEMYKQALLPALPQLNQLCAILRNCNPTAYQNSLANQMGYNVAALPAFMPSPIAMLGTLPSTNYYAPAPPSSVTPIYSAPVPPPYPATMPVAPASVPNYATPAPPSYPTTTPRASAPMPSYTTPIPPPYSATAPRAPAPINYPAPAPPSYPTTISGAPAAMLSYGAAAPPPYPATTPRAPAPVPSYAAPALPSYPATTPRAPALPNYPPAPAPMAPSRPYPITVFSTY